MSDLARILGLAGLATEKSVAAPADRELKEQDGCPCCGGGHCKCSGDCPDCNCHGNNDEWDESVEEASKPDFRDVDGDGDREESWKDAEEDKEEALDEAKLSPEQKDRLEDLLGYLKYVTDPEYWPDDGDNDSSPSEIIDTIRSEFGDKIADQAQNGIDNAWHWGRQHRSSGNDKLAWRKPTRVTKSGKANKTDVNALKNRIKWDNAPFIKDPKAHREKMMQQEEALDEAAAKIACLGCDEVSTAKAWEKNHGFCPKCKTSSQGVAESIEEDDELTESPTMDTTQLVIMMRNAGLSEEVISQKLDEWANTPEGVGEVEPTAHGDAYDFAQSVNLSLKRYLDAQDMKVQVTEHKVENMKALYEAHKAKK